MHYFLAALFVFVSTAHAQTITYYANGTGFIVSRDGYIVSNEHVVRQCQNNEVFITGAIEAKARIISVNRANDLALLKMDETARNTAKILHASHDVRIGSEVVIVGYPKGNYAKRTSTLLDAPEGVTSTRPLIYFDPALAQGNSGGPVLDDAGNVIGVAVAMTESFLVSRVTGRPVSAGKQDIAIARDALRPFLKRHGVRYEASQSTGRRTASFIESQARNYIVKLQCVTGNTHP